MRIATALVMFASGLVLGMATKKLCLSNSYPSAAPIKTTERPPSPQGRLISKKRGNHEAWKKIESANLVRYRDNLLAVGCPKDTLEDILIAKVHCLFLERQIRMGESDVLTATNYWITGVPKWFLPANVRAREAQRDLKEGAFVKSVLNIDFEDYKVHHRYAPLTFPSADPDPAYFAVPNLYGFNASKSEFDLIAEKFSTAQATMIAIAMEKPRRKDETEKNKEIASQRDEEIRQALGDTRYEEFTRFRDPRYRDLNSLATEGLIPQSAVEEAYALVKKNDSIFGMIRSGTNESTKDLNLTVRRNNAKIAEILGPENYSLVNAANPTITATSPFTYRVFMPHP